MLVLMSDSSLYMHMRVFKFQENYMQSSNAVQRIQHLIAAIDQLIQTQINKVLHHPQFQQLEASFRGLYYLAGEISQNNQPRVKLRVLNISWQELSKDLSRAAEFDQSQLFLKIYTNEFGQPGGEPFGLLIGDYCISHRPCKGIDNISILRTITKIAAAAFAPFIAAIAPGFLGFDDFANLTPGLNLNRTFQQAEYQQWKALRQDEDARFLGLLLPQILLRLPWQKTKALRHPFYFNEETATHSAYLWGNPAWCFAAVAVRTFEQTGWFSAIRGAGGEFIGGRIQNLPSPVVNVDQSMLALKAPVNVYITDNQEKELTDQGFIPVCSSKKPGMVLFYDCPSVQKPKTHDSSNASENSKLSSQLHYILCVSRFAHYVKIIARNKMGTFTSAKDCEKKLQDWIHQYVVASQDLSETLKIKYPLRDAKVEVFERPGDTGVYLCTMHISPHYQFDFVQTDLRFITELAYVR